MEKEDKKVNQNTIASHKNEVLRLKLNTTVKIEREHDDSIDLTGLHEIKAADMVAVNRRLTRSGNIDASQEISLEYALNIAHVATGIPLEFFDQLPPYAALEIRGRVTGFLFGRE